MLMLAAGSKSQDTGGTGTGGKLVDGGSTPERQALDAYIKNLGKAHANLVALDKAQAADVACDGAALGAKAQKDEYKSVKVQFLHGPFLARFASTKKEDWVEDKGPWAWATDSAYRGHFAQHPDGRTSYSVSDTARRVTKEFNPQRFHLILWPTEGAAMTVPRYDKAKDALASGSWKGRLVLVDVTDGSVACHKQVFVQSSDIVKFRTGGRGVSKLFSTTPEKAVQQDFEDNMYAAIQTMLPPPFALSVKMGSIF